MKTRKKLNEESAQALEVASFFVIKYIMHNGTSIKDFYTINNIDRKEFNIYIDIVRKHNSELYKEYIKKKNNIDANSIKNINTIKEMIINNVKENNKQRKFELFDYFQLTTLNLQEFYELIESELTHEELKIVKSFVLNNIHILKERRPLSKTRSKLIYTIDGNIVESTKEDEEDVKQYLKENNIPIIEPLYIQAMRRHIENKVYKK